MKGEIKVNTLSSRNYNHRLWAVSLWNWDFPLNKERKQTVKMCKQMEGFVAFNDPNIRDGNKKMSYWALFNSEEYAKSAQKILFKSKVTTGVHIFTCYAQEKDIPESLKPKTGYDKDELERLKYETAFIIRNGGDSNGRILK